MYGTRDCNERPVAWHEDGCHPLCKRHRVRHCRIFQYLFDFASSAATPAFEPESKYLERTMTRKFEAIALGTGSAALAVASRSRNARDGR
jgi:hypothetical protein